MIHNILKVGHMLFQVASYTFWDGVAPPMYYIKDFKFIDWLLASTFMMPGHINEQKANHMASYFLKSSVDSGWGHNNTATSYQPLNIATSYQPSFKDYNEEMFVVSDKSSVCINKFRTYYNGYKPILSGEMWDKEEWVRSLRRLLCTMEYGPCFEKITIKIDESSFAKTEDSCKVFLDNPDAKFVKDVLSHCVNQKSKEFIKCIMITIVSFNSIVGKDGAYKIPMFFPSEQYICSPEYIKKDRLHINNILSYEVGLNCRYKQDKATTDTSKSVLFLLEKDSTPDEATEYGTIKNIKLVNFQFQLKEKLDEKTEAQIKAFLDKHLDLVMCEISCGTMLYPRDLPVDRAANYMC